MKRIIPFAVAAVIGIAIGLSIGHTPESVRNITSTTEYQQAGNAYKVWWDAR
jgi:hypothetical protein